MSGLSECPKCREASVKSRKRKGYIVMYCINKACGWMRSTGRKWVVIGLGLMMVGCANKTPLVIAPEWMQPLEQPRKIVGKRVEFEEVIVEEVIVEDCISVEEAWEEEIGLPIE